MTDKKCPICAMPWEPDMDVFGCWCCGFRQGDNPDDPKWQEMKQAYKERKEALK